MPENTAAPWGEPRTLHVAGLVNAGDLDGPVGTPSWADYWDNGRGSLRSWRGHVTANRGAAASPP